MSHPELIALETCPEGDVVHLHACAAGLRSLAEQLLALADQAERGDFPHAHLLTQEWGGYELTALPHDAANTVVHHLKVFGWPTNEGGLPYRQLPAVPGSDSQP